MCRVVRILVVASLAIPGIASAQRASINDPSSSIPAIGNTAIGNTGGPVPGSAAIAGPMTSPPVIGGTNAGIAPAGTPATIGETSMGEGMGEGMMPPGKAIAGPGKPIGDNALQRQGSALAPGANSFTMSQARGRLLRHGYSQVSGLHKDSQGVWHGTAMKDGQPAHVALDYQGRVVGQ